MSEVPLYDGRTCPVLFCQMANLEILFGPRKSQRCLEKCFTTLTTFSIWWGGGGRSKGRTVRCLAYRGTSLKGNSTPLEHCSKTMPRALWYI